MAIDRSIGQYHDASNARLRKIGRITGPSSYVTGGDPITPGGIGMGTIECLHFEDASNAALTAIYSLFYNRVTGNVLWLNFATGAEAVAGTDLSGYSARFEAIGH